MLPSASSLNTQILALPPTLSGVSGVTQFVNAVASFLNQMQGGPTGSTGIFTFNNAAAIAALSSLQPVNDNSWIMPFANGIHAGTTAAILVPGTITDPAWTASVNDIGPVSITTLSSALSTLISGLQGVSSSNNPAMPMAEAIRNYGLAFTFQTTGLVADPPSAPFPLPLTFPAE